MVRGLGVVLRARRRCWWRPASTFVPAERIRHIVINEVRRMAPYSCEPTSQFHSCSRVGLMGAPAAGHDAWAPGSVDENQWQSSSALTAPSAAATCSDCM